MAKMAAASGTSAIIATPHSSYQRPLNHAHLAEAVEELNSALAAEEIDLKIYPGAEHRVSPYMLDEEAPISLAESAYVLIELPFNEFPFFMEDLVFNLRLRELTPIIAHPERNTVIQKNPGRLEQLVAQGCLAQVNSASIQKRFGAERSAGVKILRKEWAFTVASDAHDTRARPSTLASAQKALVRLVGAGQAEILLSGNPSLVLGNKA